MVSGDVYENKGESGWKRGRGKQTVGAGQCPDGSEQGCPRYAASGPTLWGCPGQDSRRYFARLAVASHDEWALYFGIFFRMSRVHRLPAADRIFLVTVNLRRSLTPFTAAEYALILESFQESRRWLGFLLWGYVFMPDHWHALFWPRCPQSISRVVQDIKYVSSRRLNCQRGSTGTLWQHQFWDRFCATPVSSTIG